MNQVAKPFSPMFELLADMAMYKYAEYISLLICLLIASTIFWLIIVSLLFSVL
jgi:hypothetical protein